VKKTLLGVFLIAFMVSGLFFVASTHFGKGQNGTTVSGVISSDTTWTQANSPYTFTANLLVNDRVTLTIQPGVTVNFNGYYLQVNGTLIAQGTTGNNIIFNIPAALPSSGTSAIEFMSSSNSWNTNTNSGCIIKNTVINSLWSNNGGFPTMLIQSSSPKLDNDTFISNNMENTLDSAISMYGSNTAPIISNSYIFGGVYAVGGQYFGNTFVNSGSTALSLGANATASDNIFCDSSIGLNEYFPYSLSSDVSMIQGNLMVDNTRAGLETTLSAYTNYPSTLIIQNNTITNNTYGVLLTPGYSSNINVNYSIAGNNIFNNGYNFWLAVAYDVNATGNWWGTTDSNAIGQTIYDFKYNFNYGNVNFAPFLTSPNPLAPIYTGPIPTPTPKPSPTATPSQTPSITPSTTPTTTPSPTPTPNLPSPNLSLYCISSTATSGFNVQIQGLLTYNGVGLSNVGIQLSDSVTGGASWQNLTYVNTDNNGSFTCVWNPLVSGNYGIEATWAGDSDYSSASATYNFAIAPFDNQNQNVFSVTSNSTLTSLAFNSTTDELSFGVSGPSGTTGLTTVCIPQSLIPVISKLNVMLDGASINYTSVSQGNVWLITFTYHHSSHKIVIALESSTTAVPEFPTWIIPPLFIVMILLSIVFARKRIQKKSMTLKAFVACSLILM
jgi:hypothetical protein